MNSKTASTSGSGSLPSNTVANPKSDLEAITTRSGVSYQGPTIPTTSSSPPKVVEHETEVTKDTLPSTNNGSTKDVQPPVVQPHVLNSEPVVIPMSAPMPNLKTSIPYPSRRNDERRREKANDQIEKFYEIFKDLSFEISLTDALILMPKFASTHKALIGNKEKLSEMARNPLNEHCSAVILNKFLEKLGDPGKFLIPYEFPGMDECLALADLGASINLMPLSVWKKLYLSELTPTCMTLELADRSISKLIGITEDVSVKVGVFHFSADFVVVDFDADPRVLLILGRSFLKTGRALIDPISLEIDDSYYGSEGDILLLEAILNSDLSPPPNQGNYLPKIRKELKVIEPKNDKTSIDEPPMVELKELPPHLEYAFLEGDDKLPVIIAKDLKDAEKAALIKVLKSHKQALAWQLSDIMGINPEFCTHKIIMEDDFTPAVQHQRRVNPKIHDVIKKEVEKLLDARLIYPISDSPWISKNGIEVDKAKVDMIAKLPDPTTVKGIRSFLGHAGFYQRFIQDFSKIARPMTRLLEKDTPFFFSNKCIQAFQTLKKKLTEAPILIAPDWDLPFELMCDASDYAIGAVLGQRKTKHFQPIHYASKTMNEAESHYTTTEKEMLAFVFQGEIDPVGSPPSRVQIQVINMKGAENSAADHLSRLENPYENVLEPKEINDTFPLETLNMVTSRGDSSTPWFVEFANYHAGKFIVKGMSSQQKNKTPRAIISDRGTHFCNDQFSKVMLKYGVTHRLATAYHPQTSGQVEVSNCGLKKILERTVGENRASWSDKLDDALWAFPYENSLIYKEKTKRIHDAKIKNRDFNVGDQVLVFNSRLKIFSGKMKSRWSGPFTIVQVFPYGTIELSQNSGSNFKVNGHRLKHYFGGDMPEVVPDLQTFPKDN
ncbi:reverse transcriptase domain-containing protein [Tanacetum coccineum]